MERDKTELVNIRINNFLDRRCHEWEEESDNS